MKKESVNKFDLEAAFKALEEIEIPVVKGIRPNRLNLQEHFTKKLTSEALVEDYYDVNDQGELEAAQEEREAEVAKAKLARIEKIVDLDAESEEDLLPSYVGKVIIQCPQCMTLFYKNKEDIEPSEENPEVVNVNEVCQHCGNSSGYTLIGKVDKVGEDEAEKYNVEDFDENELNLDFEDAEEPSEEESVEDNVEDVTAEEGNEEEIELEPVEEVEEASKDEEEVKESLNEKVEDESKEVEETPDEEILTSVEEVKEVAEEAAEAALEASEEETLEDVKEVTDEVVENHFEVSEEEPEKEESEEKVNVEENLTEAVDKDLDAKLKAHNEYIEYWKKMLEQEEKALSRADNEYVKKAIQRRIDAFKADLEDALPEELKNEVETDLPTAEEINLEATENVEEPKEETKESLKEEKINIDYVVSLFGDDSHYYKEDDVKLSPDISGATKFNKKKDISILDIVKDICEYESKYMPENEVASLFDLNTLEEVYEKDEDYFINSGLVKIITVYKNKKIKLPESLEEAIQKNPNISAEEINKIIKDKKLLQKEKAKKIYEDVKIISDLSDYKPWSGAVDTWNKIQEANKIDELDAMLEEVYPDGLTMTELNDILWFDSDWVLSGLGISEEVEECLTEATPNSPRVRHQYRREIFAKELALHPAFEGISIRDLERYIIDLYLEDDPNAELNVDQVVEYVEDLGWGKIILDNIDNLSEGQIRHFAQKDPVFVSVVKEFLGDWLTPNKNYSVGALISELLAFLGKKPADKEEAKDFKFDPNDKSYKEFKDELIDLYYKAKSSAPVKEAVNSAADSLQESGDLDTLLDSEEFKKPISDAEVENIIAKYESLDEDVKPGIESELAIQDIVDTWESIEEIDEESLDKLTENYLTEVYSNVKSFKTTNCALEKNKLVVEGKITFNSGKEKNTKFVFEAKKENNKIILEGLNADFATEKAFVLNCNLDTANRLVVESLNYKYTINNTLVEGLVK